MLCRKIMFLCVRGIQYRDGECVGTDRHENLFNNFFVFFLIFNCSVGHFEQSTFLEMLLQLPVSMSGDSLLAVVSPKTHPILL